MRHRAPPNNGEATTILEDPSDVAQFFNNNQSVSKRGAILPGANEWFAKEIFVPIEDCSVKKGADRFTVMFYFDINVAYSWHDRRTQSGVICIGALTEIDSNMILHGTPGGAARNVSVIINPVKHIVT